MKALLQRVHSAKVQIKKTEYSKIDKGLLVFLGISSEDNEEDVKFLINKILHLRIFPSINKGMDKSIRDIKGSVLVVSQFTLYGDCTKGRRPSFIKAAPSEYAKKLYLYFISCLAEHVEVKKGKFGEDMDIELINAGPATFMLES